MKLYHCAHTYCGISALQVLTGLTTKTLTRLVMNARKRCPRDDNGYRCPRKRMLPTVSHGVFFSEIIDVINRRRLCKKRVVGVYDLTFKKNVRDFALQFPIGTYMIMISRHFIILRDGKTYDNQAWGCMPSNHPFYYDIVIAYAVLDPNETPASIIVKGH